jgi:hypothetical protein
VADIFVSYTSKDREWAFWIGQELLKLGHAPYVSEWEIGDGGDIEAWREEPTIGRTTFLVSSANPT